jgi:hypothetical protein
MASTDGPLRLSCNCQMGAREIEAAFEKYELLMVVPFLQKK